MEPDAITEAAAFIARHRLAMIPMPRLPEDLRPKDEDEAYAIQDALHERLIASGLQGLAGFKIGCTTPVMQRYLGIDQPCAGGILRTLAMREHASFRHRDFLRVGVECEIAVRLGRDLGPDRAPFDRANVADAIDAAMAAIEIVDDRYEDYRATDTPTLIADDFFNAGCVTGAPFEDPQSLDLAALTGRMAINGEEIGEGEGADILGHPLEALAWLANARARRGHGLAAGQIVLLGSVVQTRWLEEGDVVEVELDRLGTASAAFL